MIRTLIFMLASTLCLAEDYYKADPAKFAEKQAERCAKAKKETSLINKRMSYGRLRADETQRMQDKLKVLEADMARNCVNEPGPTIKPK